MEYMRLTSPNWKRPPSLKVLTILFALIALLAYPNARAQQANSTEPKLLTSIATLAVPVPQAMPLIEARFDQRTGDAFLVIDNQDILKINSAVRGQTPLQRAMLIQGRLTQFLQQGGNTRDIKPGMEGNNVVIRMGQQILLTVDSMLAQKNHTPERQLAIEWVNLIRRAMGTEVLTRDETRIASRGFSPWLRQVNPTGIVMQGFASWYGPGFHGRRCANGERFNMHSLTAAHRTLPFGTIVRVTNKRTGRSALVRITDRGPYAHHRIIDLSRGAAEAIGMLSSGTAPVSVEVMGR